MKDFSGKPLKEGDIVATNDVHYRCTLIKARVIGFTPKMIRLEMVEPATGGSARPANSIFTKTSHQVSLIEGMK